MKKTNSKFQTQFVSEAGGKLINRDYFAFVELDKFACYILADGIDEDPKLLGAQMAVTAIIRSFTEDPGMSKAKLRKYVHAAQKVLEKESKDFRLKVTLTLVISNYVQMRYCVVGNTRFYLVRNDRLFIESKDQSLTQQLANRSEVAQDKIALHQEKNNLYCYLGQEGRLQIDISKKIKLVDGDIWAMLSRGAWEYCDKGEVIDATSDAKTPQEVVDHIEELVLARQPEDLDNYTIAVTFADKTYVNPKPKPTFKQIFFTLLPILIIALVLGITFYIFHLKRVRNEKDFESYKISAAKYVGNDNYPKANENYTEAVKLAKTLKLKKEQGELDQKQKLMDQILLAKTQLEEGKYEEAIDAFLIAGELSKEAEDIAKAYIDKQIEKAKAHLLVMEMIMDADKQADHGELVAARGTYQKAKELASNLYFKEAKAEALQKRDEMDKTLAGLKAEETAAHKEAKAEAEEAAKVAEEEKKAKEEETAKRLAMQKSALDLEKEARLSIKIGDYEAAKLNYKMAAQMYQELELPEWEAAVAEKLREVDNLILKSDLLGSNRQD